MAKQPGEGPLAASAAAEPAAGDEDLDIELALLTLAEDTGGPTEEVDLNALSPAEKRALLAYLRQRLGMLAPREPD